MSHLVFHRSKALLLLRRLPLLRCSDSKIEHERDPTQGVRQHPRCSGPALLLGVAAVATLLGCGGSSATNSASTDSTSTEPTSTEPPSTQTATLTPCEQAWQAAAASMASFKKTDKVGAADTTVRPCGSFTEWEKAARRFHVPFTSRTDAASFARALCQSMGYEDNPRGPPVKIPLCEDTAGAP